MPYGIKKHVAVPCDDENGRTYDIFRHGVAVAQGFATRAEARTAAGHFDLHETRQDVERFIHAVEYGDREEIRETARALSAAGRFMARRAMPGLGLAAWIKFVDLKQPVRRDERVEFNIAADLAINEHLVAAGFYEPKR